MEGGRDETKGKVEEKDKTDTRPTSSTTASRRKALWGHFTQQTEKVEDKAAESKERTQSLNRDSTVDAKKL